MTQEEYTEMLQQLKSGTITEITVEQENFMVFRKAWLSFSDRASFIGEAGLNGTVTYKYVPIEDNV
ncbi:MAG: hypothetical protein L0L10_03905 [Tetragenococcus sp.]|nr:hypothetical protein [Tetragenococcus sp.]